MNVRNYALVTSAYWGFTLTAGALRKLVLLHFNQLGHRQGSHPDEREERAQGPRPR
jgi:hypothetical protein